MAPRGVDRWWAVSGWGRVGVALVGVAVLVGGCSSSGPVFEGPWAEELQWAYDSATTDFQREVLEDGRVTAEEYHEAAMRLEQCMEDRGYRLSINMDGDRHTYTYSMEASAGADDAFNECSLEMSSIESLYGGMSNNPENRDLWEIYVECMHRHGLVDEDFTRDDLWDLALEEATALPSGARFDEGQAHECILNPHD